MTLELLCLERLWGEKLPRNCSKDHGCSEQSPCPTAIPLLDHILIGLAAPVMDPEVNNSRFDMAFEALDRPSN